MDCQCTSVLVWHVLDWNHTIEPCVAFSMGNTVAIALLVLKCLFVNAVLVSMLFDTANRIEGSYKDRKQP
jgi:lipoprotein signal peptidase